MSSFSQFVISSSTGPSSVCRCPTCAFTQYNPFVAANEGRYSYVMRCMVHMCVTHNVSPPVTFSTDNNTIRKCIIACNDTDNLHAEAAREYALMDIVRTLGHHVNPCIFDLYSSYLFEVNHSWALSLWLEATRFIASINITISKKSILILENMFEMIYSKLTDNEDYEHQPDDLQFVDNICHIFYKSNHFPKELISKLYLIVDCDNGMELVPLLKQTGTYLEYLIARNDPTPVKELDCDILKWNYQIVPPDDLSERRLYRLLYFKIRLGLPSSVTDLFNFMFVEQLIGDSPIKELLVDNFETYIQSHPEHAEAIRATLLETTITYAYEGKWDVAGLNIRILGKMGREYNDLVHLIQSCVNHYRPNELNEFFTEFLIDVLFLFYKEKHNFSLQQIQAIENLFNLFTEHLTPLDSCFDLSERQYIEILDLALSFKENRSHRYQGITKKLVSAFESALHCCVESTEFLLQLFCERWANSLDDHTQASKFHELFEDDTIWNHALSSEIQKTTISRIRILNKLLSNRPLLDLFLPQETARDHLGYILGVTSQSNVVGYRKNSPHYQEFLRFGTLVNSVLELIDQDVYNGALPYEIYTISIYFSILCKFYAEEAKDQELQSFDSFLKVILVTADENGYDHSVLHTVKLLTQKKVYLENSEATLTLFGICKLLNLINYVMNNDTSDSYDFSETLNYYQNQPLMRDAPHQNTIQNLIEKHQLLKNLSQSNRMTDE
ncbi:predicted protein [Naegleria gruberi]|uniref:Predicted protein n=1 Tax=Naegleria gruberi TaxID=5762 RepID=D2V736_NAEGR|nr:uncharacterized protein NAEGRDRAFT_64657 [Naegleria gruberi]EFC47191.1 predicted protein [Naegleria gruberi]|eukprot:XP_002679935.1 predicted protein [Naegleria gruberi strain NEG-M]